MKKYFTIQHIDLPDPLCYKTSCRFNCILYIGPNPIQVLVKASVGQTDVQRFEPHLGHNWLSCGVFLVKSRHFGLPLAQTLKRNWHSLLAGGSGAIQTWSIYLVYT